MKTDARRIGSASTDRGNHQESILSTIRENQGPGDESAWKKGLRVAIESRKRGIIATMI